jgi:phosphatidylglycerophosphate synthase
MPANTLPSTRDASSLPDRTHPRQIAPRTLDEWISCGRLVLAALLWIPALLRRPRVVAAGIVLSACSDTADGAVARLQGGRSNYSRQLDAVADSAVMLSSLGWLAVARPGALRPLSRCIGAIAAVAAVLLTIEWRRYRKLGALHIGSARAAAVVGHLCVLDLFWRGSASRAVLRLFQFLTAGAMIESAWVILGNHDLDDHTSFPLLKRVCRKMRS